MMINWLHLRYISNRNRKMPKWRAPRGEMSWTVTCSMCQTSAYRSVQKNIARNPWSDVGVLGYLFTNNEISAHEECLRYGHGDDLIQHPDHVDIHEEHFNGYKIQAIKNTIESHKKRKCGFCDKKGACSECASLRCTGKMGW